MTLFPDEVDAFLASSVIGRARKAGRIDIKCYNIRDYSENKHRRVDDTLYGGGFGMLLQPGPICRCFDAVLKECPDTHAVYMSPKGRKFTQAKAKRMLKYPSLTILCGHYEGVDQRALDIIQPEELSVGDYILTGGEIPAMAVVDAVSRMTEGVLPARESFEDESIYSGLLEYPQYTKPAKFRGLKVPEVLQNGNHELIRQWRKSQALEITKARRKDLYRAYIRAHPEEEPSDKF